MKKLFFGLFILSGCGAEPVAEKEKAVVKVPWSMQEHGDRLIIKKSVEVETGTTMPVSVFYTLHTKKKTWEGFKALHANQPDELLFDSLAYYLNFKAKHTLTNHISFEPFDTQSIEGADSFFTCRYKMREAGLKNTTEEVHLVTHKISEGRGY